MKKQIHQLVTTLSYGDAISGEVLSLKRCLQKLGYESEIYAMNIHSFVEKEARDYRDFPTDFKGEVLLHYSLGSPLNKMYLKMTSAKRGIIYHNITPAKWFRGVNPRIVADIENGFKELPVLLEQTDRIIADSSFNVGELKELGFEATRLQIPIDPIKWDIEPNAGICSLVNSDPSVHLLHVGRVAPNKCIEDIIKVFYFLHHHVNKQSKLWLVGIDTDTELYSFALKRLAHELKVDHAVNFVGCMSDAEVKALYHSATAYLCMSEHEGFCLPVVEAMHFGLPVVAYNCCALPDTVGSGGVLFNEKRHPEVAELINQIYEDNSLRDKLVSAGKARVEEFAINTFEAEVKAIFSQSDAVEQMTASA